MSEVWRWALEKSVSCSTEASVSDFLQFRVPRFRTFNIARSSSAGRVRAEFKTII